MLQPGLKLKTLEVLGDENRFCQSQIIRDHIYKRPLKSILFEWFKLYFT